MNYDLIKRSGEAEDLIVDLAVLSKKDGEIEPGELPYVESAAKKLNIHALVYEKMME